MERTGRNGQVAHLQSYYMERLCYSNRVCALLGPLPHCTLCFESWTGQSGQFAQVHAEPVGAISIPKSESVGKPRNRTNFDG
jgi:hypothetical protein